MAPEHLRISANSWQAMLQHVRSCLPEEACGLLGGDGEQVTVVLPVENLSHSSVRFRMEPAAQVRALLHLDEAGQDLVGIFHSHPAGPPAPSITDAREAAYPEAAYLVWSPEGQGWRCEAFRMDAGRFMPIELEREDG